MEAISTLMNDLIAKVSIFNGTSAGLSFTALGAILGGNAGVRSPVPSLLSVF